MFVLKKAEVTFQDNTCLKFERSLFFFLNLKGYLFVTPVKKGCVESGPVHHAAFFAPGLQLCTIGIVALPDRTFYCNTEE